MSTSDQVVVQDIAFVVPQSPSLLRGLVVLNVIYPSKPTIRNKTHDCSPVDNIDALFYIRIMYAFDGNHWDQRKVECTTETKNLGRLPDWTDVRANHPAGSHFNIVADAYRL